MGQLGFLRAVSLHNAPCIWLLPSPGCSHHLDAPVTWALPSMWVLTPHLGAPHTWVLPAAPHAWGRAEGTAVHSQQRLLQALSAVFTTSRAVLELRRADGASLPQAAQLRQALRTLNAGIPG